MEEDHGEQSNETLEVPSETARAIRKEALVDKLMHTGKERQKPMTLGRSAILDQVKEFVPKLKSANDQLNNIDRAEVQVDNPAEGEAYVEMNVDLFENSGTSDSDSDSTHSAVSKDSPSESSDSDSENDAVPVKQRKLITEMDEGEAS